MRHYSQKHCNSFSVCVVMQTNFCNESKANDVSTTMTSFNADLVQELLLIFSRVKFSDFFSTNKVSSAKYTSARMP